MARAIDRYGLRRILGRIDGRGYGAYRVLRGITIDYGIARAVFAKVQSDPYAPPSVLEAFIPSKNHGLPEEFLRAEFETPLTDYVARAVYTALASVRRKCGSGYSCYIGFPKPGPWVLRRSCVDLKNGGIVLRLYVGLPASGRRVLGGKAFTLLADHVMLALRRVVELRNDREAIRRHIMNYVDQEYLRRWLYSNDYMLFIRDGSVLPRASSVTELPMKGAVPFRPPSTLRVSVRLPSGKVVTGMAVRRGLLLITGGAYHGKTTLLEAIQEGIYNHVEGDGREGVVSRKYAVMVRAEDGRIVTHVDISTFIGKLPTGTDTRDYVSLDSSGSTSMAASINEAVEAGADLILIDEDTSATNLLYKDEVMAKIIPEDPIRPLSAQVRDMIAKAGVGVVAVLSASSAFIEPSDRVIAMRAYIPNDITGDVKGSTPNNAELAPYRRPRPRFFMGVRGLRRVRSRGYKVVADYVNGERFEVDLTYYPRIVERGQVKLLAHIIERVSRIGKPMLVRNLVSHVNSLFRREGFSAFTDIVTPDLTEVDGFDVVWVLNRLYNAVFTQQH